MKKLLNSIKNFLKKLIPVSYAKMDSYITQLKISNDKLQKQNAKLAKQNDELMDMLQDLNKVLKGTRKRIRTIETELSQMQLEMKAGIQASNESAKNIKAELKAGIQASNESAKNIKAELQKVHSTEQQIQSELKAYAQKQQISLEETLGYARENNWGLVFNNTISACDWLSELSFSFGRWAIGYQCAYVLFRVLDEIRPAKVLELGLGQSTKLLGQYAGSHDGIRHVVVESDENWIDFFKNNYKLSDKSHIIRCDYAFIDYNEAESVRVFDGLADKLAGEKWNLIMIDAPFAGDMKELARIDVLLNLPDCIEDSFVIMIDDVERPAEQNTFNEMRKKLEVAGIPFASNIYKGKKSVGVIASENLKFILTM